MYLYVFSEKADQQNIISTWLCQVHIHRHNQMSFIHTDAMRCHPYLYWWLKEEWKSHQQEQ